MTHSSSHEGEDQLQNKETPERKKSPGRMRLTYADEVKSELRDALKGVLLACQTDITSEIKGGEDFWARLNEIENQTDKEQLILLQIFRAFVKAKPEHLPTLCELAGILLSAFKNKDIRPELSSQLEGMVPELLLEIAEEKFKSTRKKEQRKAAAEMFEETNPVLIKSTEELEEGIGRIPAKTEKETKILQNLLKGIHQASDTSLFDLGRRILTAFHHSENRPKISDVLGEMQPEELQEIAEEMLGVVPQKIDTGRLSIEAVRQILDAKTKVSPSTKSVPRLSTTDAGKKDASPTAREEAVTRKIVTRTIISAVLNSGHLDMEIEKLHSEKIITPDTEAHQLLVKTHKLLKDIEVKETKEKTENINRLEIALKDFAGKLMKTLRKSNPQKNKERFRILSKLLYHTGNQLVLLALIMTPKRAEDIKIIGEELKANQEKLTRWTDEDNKRLARANMYFENGEKSMDQIEDEEKKEGRQERFRNALEDCSSLIVIGLSSSEKERSGEQFRSKIKDLLEQIEVDAQGLEIDDLKDESSVVEETDAHVTEQKMDPAEKERLRKALRIAQEYGLKEGLEKANRMERIKAEAEAKKAKDDGLLDFGNVEDLLSSALGE